jgi:hypothetical protein
MRVGDDLAADQRGLHPGRAHRDAVGDDDGVEVDRIAARRDDPGADVGLASRSRCMLHGVTDDQVLTTAIIGLSKSASFMPAARR